MERSDHNNVNIPVSYDTERRTNQPTINFEDEQVLTMTSSPQVTFEVINDDRHHDDNSLGLCNSSFDTLSDAGAVLSVRLDETAMTDTSHRHGKGLRAANRNANRMFSSPIMPHTPSPNDIDLPELNSPNTMSLGDLSPIKMIYSEGRAPRIERRMASHSLDAFRENESEVPIDWRNDEMNVLYTNNRSNPFYVLRSARNAFSSFRYPLPCLKLPPSDTNTITMSNFGGIRQYKDKKKNEEQSSDSSVSTRRVESAICAFGGTLNPKHNQFSSELPQNRESIGGLDESNSSNHYSTTAHSDDHHASQLVTHDNIDAAISKNNGQYNQSRHGSQNSSNSSSDSISNDATKLKYKCKRCGQLKQNHVCPDQQPLQRSIGVMVYPAVNSYNASEPGVIAPSLSKMNNFISYDDSDHGGDPTSDHVTQQRPKIDDGNPFVVHSMTVTPESLRGAFRSETTFHSPQSSLSAQSSDDPMSRHTSQLNNASTIKNEGRRTLKRSHGDLMESATFPGQCESMRNSVFVASVSLRPEQYRAVTPFTKGRTTKPDIGGSAITPESAATAPTTSTKVLYQYPVISLSFAERKRLCDTLFYLSQEIPAMTCDCATLLRTARQNNEWDIAVAELLTQVIVALYCGEGDVRLNGLQQFLLSIGIAC